MISTWATELYLDKIKRLLLDDDKQTSVVSSSSDENNTKYQNILSEFRDFSVIVKMFWIKKQLSNC